MTAPERSLKLLWPDIVAAFLALADTIESEVMTLTSLASQFGPQDTRAAQGFKSRRLGEAGDFANRTWDEFGSGEEEARDKHWPRSLQQESHTMTA
jgi:hypothetical protein